MSVVCAACFTENRDNAMFCHGCAGKLPAFAPTAPSALEAMKARPSVGRPRPAPPAALPFEKPGSWIWAGALIFAIVLGFFGWYVYVTRKVPPPAPVAANVPSAHAGAGIHRQPAAERQTLHVPPVPLAVSLSPLESVVDSGRNASPSSPAVSPESATQAARPSTRVAATAPAAAPPPASKSGPDETMPPEKEPAPVSSRPQPMRIAAAHPMRGCEHLNFIFAARCEAINCDKPEFKRHPRCDAVRADRRRDEARRNPTLGF